SNESGYYEVPLLDPGNYTITAEMAGFRRFVRKGVTLNVNSRAGIAIRLELGNVAEVIEVAAQAPLLETTTASAGRVVDNRQIMELPYSDLNPYVLAGLAAGMQWTGAPDANRTLWSGGGTSAFNTAGGVGQNEYSIDGVPNTGSNRRVAFIAPSDAVGEFRLETANFDASFGHTSGATINLSTKSGTNQFHGTVYTQHWQQRWNATQHFARLAWENAVRRNALSKDTPKQQSGRSNSPGATIGGPVVIPKIFNGRDQLFFFFNYSGIYQNLTDQPDRLNRTVPKEAWRSGDFSDLLAIDPTLYQIYDPRTARLSGNRVVRDPFPGNRGIPVLNPMYAFYEKLYPLPNNVPGLVTREGFNNYFAAAMPKIDRHHSLLNRVDWEASRRHKISGRWYWNHRTADTSDWTYETSPGLHSSGTTRVNKAASADWVWAVSPTNVLNVTLGYNRFVEFAGETGPRRFKPSEAGLPSYLDERAGPEAILPTIDFDRMQDVSYPAISPTTTSTGMLKGQLLRVQGNHSLKLGFDTRRTYRARMGAGFSSGRFIFRNTYTRQASDNTTASNHGLEWAAFLMGVPTSIQIDTNDSYYLVNPYTAFYVQDDLRLSRRFRMNLGLRVEIEGGASERFNRGLAGGFYFDDKLPISDLVETAYARNPIAELASANFRVRGGTRYLGQDAPTTISKGTSNLLPRVGLVYELTPKTVVRGGYGWFFDTNTVANFEINQWGYSQATVTEMSLDNGLTFTTNVRDPFPVRADGTRFDQPLRNSLGAMARAGQTWDYIDPEWKAQFQQRWRFSIQRELTRDMVAEIGYTGAYSKTNVTRRLDFLPPQFWATGMVRNSAIDTSLNASLPNPFQIGNLAPLQASSPVLYNYLRNQGRFSGTTIRRHELLRAYPHLTRLQNTTSPDGRVRYSALEVQLEKRFSRGFMFTGLYTFADSETRDWYANEFDALPSWRPNNNTLPHRFVFTAIYEFPFGPGKRLLSSGLAGQLLGGWQLSTVFQKQSGPAISWGNEFYLGDLNDVEAAFNHDGAFAGDIHQWFDPKMPFEKDSARRPGTFHARVFPDRIGALR
ncbi:MAG: TonB-dependent receptor, partial [Gammaproteobacteria bacterium]